MDTLFNKFATLIVNEDFSEASLMLSMGCRYSRNGSCLEGRDEIVDYFRSSAVWARDNFDLVLHDHKLGTDPCGSTAITFTDILELKNTHVIHESVMHLKVDHEGLICELRMVESTIRPDVVAFFKGALPRD